jgi:hypothetical protein
MCDQDEAWAGVQFTIPGPELTADAEVETPSSRNAEEPYNSPYTAAVNYMKAMGLKPTPDAIEQLNEAFLPALQIICERGYSPIGATWKTGGWKGQVYEILKKSIRLKHKSWQGSEMDVDSTVDIINFAGFLLRAWRQGLPRWAEYGAPDDNQW